MIWKRVILSWMTLLALVFASTGATPRTDVSAKTHVGAIDLAAATCIEASGLASAEERQGNRCLPTTVTSNVPHTARGAAQAPKLLNAVPKSVLNASNHIFGPKSLAKHKMGPVLESFGGDAVAATYRLQNAAQTLANQGAIQGVFRTTVQVAGQNVTVGGRIVDGVVKLGTAFIP